MAFKKMTVTCKFTDSYNSSWYEVRINGYYVGSFDIDAGRGSLNIVSPLTGQAQTRIIECSKYPISDKKQLKAEITRQVLRVADPVFYCREDK